MEDLIINFEEIGDSTIIFSELDRLCDAVAQFSKNFDKICFLFPDYCFRKDEADGDIHDDGLLHSKEELKKIAINTMQVNFVDRLRERKEKYNKELNEVCEQEHLTDEELAELIKCTADGEVWKAYENMKSIKNGTLNDGTLANKKKKVEME